MERKARASGPAPSFEASRASIAARLADAHVALFVDFSGAGPLVERKAEEWYSCTADDFGSVRGETRWRRALSRGDWSVTPLTRTVLTCDADSFSLTAELDAYEREQRACARNWNRWIPRRLL